VLNLLPSNVAVPRPGRLEGRRVLVVKTEQHDAALAAAPTEATMSLLFAREGARVAIADADERAAMETVDRIKSDGGDAYAIGADLAFEADVGWMVREACKALGGGLDGLVLNAASGGNAEHHQLGAQEWARIFDLNVRGPMLCCREALSNFRDGGSVVFTASCGLGTGRRRMAYDSVKAAIVGLMRNIAEEVASRAIRANLVYSGPQCAPPCFGPDAYAFFDHDRMAPGSRAAEQPRQPLPTRRCSFSPMKAPASPRRHLRSCTDMAPRGSKVDGRYGYLSIEARNRHEGSIAWVERQKVFADWTECDRRKPMYAPPSIGGHCPSSDA
jgi:NAD(P)-dependent dehydrogenase (short-subunit alcohol dehydrogenase family)